MATHRPLIVVAGAIQQLPVGDNTPADDGRIAKSGFPVDTSGEFGISLSYNEATRTVTITPTGSAFDLYVQGVKYSKTGAQSLAHGAAQGGHFIYYDATGALVTSQTQWNLDQCAPVAYVFWDATNARGICMYETHHAGRDVWAHERLHAVDGTQVISGFAAAGYTLATTSDAAISYSIASGIVADEDLRTTTDALADTGPYTILYRTGVNGDWVITRGNTIPVLQAANSLQYNQFTGATWQLTAHANATFGVYWVFAVPALSGSGQQIVIVPGQATYATLTLAQAASVAGLSWGTMPFQEIAPLYQVIMQFRTAYAGTARCRIESINRVVGSRATITAVTQTAHGALTGLSDLDAHPASSITNTPAGNLVATTVQDAINEIDTEKAPLESPTFTGTTTIDTADINGGTIDGTVIGGTSKAAGGFTDLTVTGNTTLGDAAADTVTIKGSRILGDFSNATVANRVHFQSSVPNSNTSVGLIPNGTATGTNFSVFSSTDSSNSSYGRIRIDNTTSYIESSANGIGAFLPLSFWAGGSEAYRINTDRTVTGLKVTELNSGPLAGFRNRIINGGFDVWQRGTTGAITGTYSHVATDRWKMWQTGATGATVSRVASDVAGFTYMMKAGRNAGNAVTGNLGAAYALETKDSISLQGKTVTLSFYAKAGANFSAASGVMYALLATGTGTDQDPGLIPSAGWTGSVFVFNTAQAITTTTTRYSFTGTISGAATQVGIYLYYMPVGTAGADDNVYVTGVQLEPGTVATPFEHRPYGVELALCQRYYYRITPTVANGIFGPAMAVATVYAGVLIPFPVPMRVAPAVLEHSGTANDYAVSFAAVTTACTSVPTTTATTTPYYAQVNFNVTTPLTPGQAGKGLCNGTTSGYLGFSAEL